MESNLNQLNQEEIQKLFAFVEAKGVQFKDVQFELVDHLASSVEELRRNNPALTFDSALQIVYRKFPLTGFHHFTDAKEIAMEEYWKKNIWDYMKEYLKLPKIILAVILFVVLFQLINIYGETAIFMLSLMLFSGMFYFVTTWKSLPFLKRNLLKDYLILNTYYKRVGDYFSSYFLCMTLLMFVSKFELADMFLETKFSLLFAWFFTFNILALPAFMIAFPTYLRRDIKTKYSHLLTI